MCKRCNKLRDIHAKGLCRPCYQNYGRKLIICKECKQKKSRGAREYCGNCYKRLFYYDLSKSNLLKKYYGDLSLELWKEVRKECVSCGFNKVVEVHHIDENSKNNSKKNLMGLCPNCHKMIHMYKYKKEIIDRLKNKGGFYNSLIIST